MEQAKVSMVMPCYNKVDYIGNMLDSVLAQKWDNIELILVNDGSTDGTREVIGEYEAKMVNRGYKCIIIDQKNAGCCAALETGFKRASGDYICVIDSDDELDSEYVSIMAGFLEENKNYDFTFCDYIAYTEDGVNRKYHLFNPQINAIDYENLNLIERFFLNLMPGMGWVYMVRASYFKYCKILETFITDTKGSYEPGLIIPLLAFGSKFKYFSLPLYRFNVGADGHSAAKKSVDGKYIFQEEYLRLSKQIICGLPDNIADNRKKERYLLLAEFFRILMSYNRAMSCEEKELAKNLYSESIEYFKKLHGITEDLNADYLYNLIDYDQDGGYKCRDLRYFGKFLLSENRPKPKKLEIKGRLIGLAAKAKAAAALYPSLQGYRDMVVELWDENADGEEFAGIKVTKPDYDSLMCDDIVVILTKNRIANEELSKILAEKSVKTVLYLWNTKSIPAGISMLSYSRWLDYILV